MTPFNHNPGAGKNLLLDLNKHLFEAIDASTTSQCRVFQNTQSSIDPDDRI